MNESLVAIPPDVAEPEVLRRFLLRLVEELDSVLGFRGNDSLVRQSDLSQTSEGLDSARVTLSSLSEDLTTLSDLVREITEESEVGADSLQAQISDLESRLSSAESTIVSHTAELADHETRIAALEAAP